MNVKSDTILIEKERQLKEIIQNLGSIAVAYSGGVDSTYLAAISNEVLRAKARMVIADSPSIPRTELNEAVRIAKERNWNLTIINTSEHLDSNYQENSGDRCYYCKSELFNEMDKWCRENNISRIAYGAIMDDLGDHRPGAKAADEHNVCAPLQDAGLSKEEIRVLSQKRGLPTFSKASFACLASRLPVGEKVTVKKLGQIEMAEEVIKKLGVNQYRARHHGDICRIEVGYDEIDTVFNPENRDFLVKEIKKLGYSFVTLDLSGYKTGSTNGTQK
ncbi:MAG: ATP-dependent sacrificial sulfur transferase LarE [Lentisphaeraceae bacterium]|nr:ATP-dependent sacrificial sulfur transferase LarE [Lentisphaeraceae bacterium]